MRKTTLLFLASILLLTHCSTESDDPRSIQGNKYSNPAIGLSLQFPADWQLTLDEKFGAVSLDLVARGPAVSNFSPNVTVIIEKHDGSAVDWNQLLSAIQSQLQAQIPDLGNYTDTVLSKGGFDYAEIGYTTLSQGNLLKGRQSFLLKKGKQVTVTYTDMASRFDQSADLQSIYASLSLY